MAENQWVKMSNGQVSRQDFIFEYKRRNPQYGDVDDSILLEALFIKNPSLTTRLAPAVPGGLITAIDSTERLQAVQTIPAELVDTGFGNRVWQNFKREITFGYAGEEIPRADSLGDSIADVTGSLAGVLLPIAVPIGGTQYALGRMAMKFPRLLKMLRLGIRAEKGVKSAKQAATAEAITRGAISNVVGFNIHGQAYKHPEHTTLQDRMKEILPTTLTALAFSGAGALTYAGKTGKVLSYPAVGAIGWEMTPDDPEDPLNTTNKIVNATALMILHKGFGNREKAIQEFVDQMYPDLPAKTRTDMVDQAMTIAKTESKAKQLDLFGEAKEPMVVVKAGEVPIGTKGTGGRNPYKPDLPSFRGTAISLNDPRIPEKVYHITTQKSAIESSGKLKAKGEGGLGGDPTDRIVSLTINEQIAKQLELDLKFTVETVKEFGEGPAIGTPGRAKISQALFDKLESKAQKEGFSLDMGRIPDTWDARDWVNWYFQMRESKLDIPNPLIHTDIKTLRGINVEDIGIIEVPKSRLKTGALVTDFDVGRSLGLEEIRIYGDVILQKLPVSKAITFKEAESNYNKQVELGVSPAQQASEFLGYISNKLGISEKNALRNLGQEWETYHYRNKADKSNRELVDAFISEKKEFVEAPAVVVPPKPSAPPPPVKPTTDFKFTDAEVEARFQAASGMQKPNLYQRIRESLSSFRQKSTREFEYLVRTPENAELAFNLRKLQKQRNVADDAAVRNIQHILEGLDAKSENLFRRKVILDDLVKTAEDGKDIPFGFELESAKSELARVDAEISKYPQISDAIQRRADYWDTLRGEYVEAMQQAGMDVSERFTNENYYRHQVLEYARVKNSVAGTGQRLKTPAGRGFLKKRKGSELDINTDYVEAEYQVMSQMFMDMEVARTIKYVDDNHNIVRQLQTGAKKKNFENLVGGKDVVRDIEHLRGEKLELQNLPEKDAAIRERLKYITEELNRLDPTSPFRQKIAIGLSKLEKDGYAILTEDGRLNFAELSRLSNEGNVSANTVFKAISERESFVRETLGENYLRWRTDIDRRVVPKEYTTWQPREGNVFYLSETIPERIVRELFEKNLEEINVPKDQIRRALTVGGKRKEFVVREEVAETLSNLMKPREENFITKFNRKMLKGWKIWALISPTRFAKYNFRNLTGDADAAFVGNPRGFGKTKQAVRELHDAFYNQKRTLEFEEWAKRGGIESTLQAQEIGNLKNLYTYLQKSKAVPEKIWKGYWRHARMSTDFRESILRYANYLDYLEQMKADSQGRPKNFGASIPGEVMALKDIRDRAFMLSNDLLGAYDRVSVTGQAIRERYIPFWSWKEVNFKRYLQLFRNAANDGELATTVGKNLLRKTTSPYTYYRVGKFAIKISAFTAMLKVWNETMFPDLEKQLSTHQRNTPHIILGQDEDGKIINFTRMGALGDFLEWFGLDAAPEYMNEYLSGRMSLAEIAQEMAKAPVNVVVQGANPFIKTPAELLMRQALFPEAFEPRVIRDRGIHIARQLGLENEYIALTGKPSRPYSEKYPHLFFYSTDPFQVSYGEIQNLKSKYMKQIGKGSVGYWISPRGDALYNMKLALRYQDTEAVKNYFIKYVRLGGTPKTLQQGLDRLDPLNGLNNKEKAHFMSRLTPEEIQHLIRAYKFWQVTMMGGGTPEINNKVKNRLGIK